MENKSKINVQELEKAIWDSMDKQRKVFPCYTNRASDIGHPCVRYLAFSRTRWQDKLLPDVELQFIFNEGNVQEEAVKRVLTDAGFNLSQQQRAAFEAPQNLSGHLDTFIEHPLLIPNPIPAEIKGLSQHNWHSINSLEDMINHKQWYVRKYPAQLMVYMYMTNKDEGLFILKNKQNGRLKFIYAHLDYAYVETLLQKAEKVNQLVADKEVGEPIDDLDCCQNCPFRHICFKDQTFGNGVIMLDDDKINARMARLNELEVAAEEHAVLDSEINEQIKSRLAQEPLETKRAQIMAGNYVFNCTKVEPKEKKPYWKIGEVTKV